MPTIRVELFEGRTDEQKRAAAQALTEAAMRTLGSHPDSVDVIFTDVRRSDWATAGRMWSEMPRDADPAALVQADAAGGQAAGAQPSGAQPAGARSSPESASGAQPASGQTGGDPATRAARQAGER